MKLYTDYRDPSLDNYPQIAVCDECYEANVRDLGEQGDLEPGEIAWCELCDREHRAAGDCWDSYEA